MRASFRTLEVARAGCWSVRFAPVGTEALLQPAPAIGVVLLQRAQVRRIAGDALPEARLEHEGQRVFELHRLELDIGGLREGVLVRSMRQQLVVQTQATV